MSKTEIEIGYDNKENAGKNAISGLRSYNNWVKSVLIKRFIPQNSSVLDFCGGKGGDLRKFRHNNIKHVLLCDLSEKSIEEAKTRYSSDTLSYDFTLETIHCDCFSDELLKKIPENSQFEAVSCQFAIHYSFESEERANQAVVNLTKYLKKGGVFVGTTVNAYRVVKKLRSVPGMKFGNEHFSVDFDVDGQTHFDKQNIPIYGVKYRFDLFDAIDGIPEYLIPFCEFQKICERNGLKLVGFWDLHKFYGEWTKDEEYRKLFQKFSHGVFLNDKQWEIIGYYCAFVFQKVE